jgi:hypothetical protein
MTIVLSRRPNRNRGAGSHRKGAWRVTLKEVSRSSIAVSRDGARHPTSSPLGEVGVASRPSGRKSR